MVVTLGRQYDTGEKPTVVLYVCCTLTSIAMQGHQTKTKQKHFEYIRAVLMGTKSCTKILNFSTRFSCENLAVEDFVTLLMGKKSC